MTERYTLLNLRRRQGKLVIMLTWNDCQKRARCPTPRRWLGLMLIGCTLTSGNVLFGMSVKAPLDALCFCTPHDATDGDQEPVSFMEEESSEEDEDKIEHAPFPPHMISPYRFALVYDTSTQVIPCNSRGRIFDKLLI